MTSPTEPRTPRLYHAGAGTPAAAFEVVIATAVVAAAMAGFLLVGAVVPPAYALVAGQAALLIVPVGAAFASGMHVRELLGFRRPRALYVLAAVMIGCTVWYVNLRAVTWLLDHDLLPTTPDTRQLDQVVERSSLAVALLTLAVIPPLCEEVLFRGVLARSLATRLPAVVAVVLSALLFSAYHFSWLQAVPTFVLGLALGAVAVRAESIVPTMIAHALNNAIAVMITRHDLPSVSAWFDRNPTPALVACSAIAVAGVALTIKGAA